MTDHDQGQLAVRCLGALAADEAGALDDHVRSCPDCRQSLDELDEIRNLLAEVPPEALLDGPAEDGDLLLGRIIRASGASTQSRRRPTDRWRRGLLVAAAILLIAGVFGGGLLTGRHTVAAQPAPLPAGTRNVSARSAQTGVGMSMDLIPSAGWVTLQGHFTGVTPGSACDIYVVTRSGQRILAGGWLAPADADKAVVTVVGSAIVAPTDIASIEVDTTQGRQLVTATT